ncbi:C2 NT-type domain-containing protein [Entamoeba marina]
MSDALLLDRQTCVMTERVGVNEIYVVVKQTNFLLCLTSTQPIENADVSCELLYDMVDLKPVSYVAQKPISYRTQQVSLDAINVECKLNVLSSQHEDMLFRIRVVVRDNGKVIGEVLSNTIQTKKPKKTDKDQSSPQRRVIELALLSSNSILLEKLKQMIHQDEPKITTVEDGMKTLLDRINAISYDQQQCYICDALGNLSSDHQFVLFEMATVIQSLYPQQFGVQRVVEQNFVPYQEFNCSYTGQQNVFDTTTF